MLLTINAMHGAISLGENREKYNKKKSGLKQKSQLQLLVKNFNMQICSIKLTILEKFIAEVY